MSKQTVLIIGEVFIDTHLDIFDVNGPLVRLGGIFHSARAFSSLGLNYALAYYAPNYLDDDINQWAFYLNTVGCYKLGNIDKSPNVMLVSDSQEAGSQGYYNILKDQAEYVDCCNVINIIDIVQPTDILIYPGRYDIKNLLQKLNLFKGKIHIDCHYDSENMFDCINMNIDSLILSTSSELYKKNCNGSLDRLMNYFENQNINRFLIKENRGGAFCYYPKEKTKYESPSYYVPTMHSVGVGDVFNAMFISNLLEDNVPKTMKLASLCAAKYAETMCYEKYKENANIIYNNINDYEHLYGIRLPWEDRSQFNIYLAAPDFPDIDTSYLVQLNNALLYHNFNPRLPIRENGLVGKNLEYDEEINIYNQDIILLEKCDLLIAVLLFNDPGTLVELGMFKQADKPTIIYDPFNYCENMFVKHTPNYLCKTLAQVIEATYLCLGRRM